MSNIYLVIVLKDGRRAWYVSDETRLNQFQQPVQIPRFDDEKSKSVSLEFALDARARFQDYCRQRLGSDLHIAVERYGDFVEENRLGPSTGMDQRVPMFVFTQGDQFGYTVSPVILPTGPAWCLKFTMPQLAEQSVFDESPEAVVEKARRLRFLEIEPPQPSPFKAQREADARAAAEQEKNRPLANLRPGDRR